ncbi:MAG: M48 family metallopeptidase [Pseudomonadales bacterium]
MKYENRQVPEGINVSNEHPLKEFLVLLAGLIVIIIAVVFVLAILAQYMAPLIPFSTEQKLLSKIETAWQESEPASKHDKKVQQYLQELGANLAAEMDLPEAMQLNIRYSKDKTVNAYATLGGNVMMYRGMLRNLPHENAVAMVLAHEIAHIKLRHPIVAAGRGITVALALASVTGLSDNGLIAGLINQIGLTSTLGFSRRQESNADKEALRALQKHYGHVNGAEVLFQVLGEHSAMISPAFLSTHPGSKQRIQRIKDFAQEHASGGDVTALPNFLQLRK